MEESGIEFTTRVNSITNPGRSHGFPNLKADNAYEYRVYVHRKNFSRAACALRAGLDQKV